MIDTRHPEYLKVGICIVDKYVQILIADSERISIQTFRLSDSIASVITVHSISSLDLQRDNVIY